MSPRPAIVAVDQGFRDPRLQPQFRTVIVRGERKAFRLEQIFWTAIDAVARRNRRTVADEVAATLAHAPAGSNHSAHLRARCAADLLDLWEMKEASAGAPAWRRVLAAMPTPAFALTRSLGLADLNGPMRDYLRRKGVAVEDGGFAPERRFAIELAAGVPGRLRLAADGSVDCNAIFIAGAQRCMSAVRLVSSNDPGQPLVMGFPIGQ